MKMRLYLPLDLILIATLENENIENFEIITNIHLKLVQNMNDSYKANKFIFVLFTS